jgi:putative tryptophan/tyrosine transport system substrate-binding protein
MIARRTFLVGLGLASLSTAVPALAQQGRARPQVGVLWHAGSAEEEKVPLGGLVEGFRDLSYVDGKNIVLEHRFPNEQPERFLSLAAELVQIKVDVLIAVTRQAAIAAQKATTTIPIVFIAVPDAVGDKLVASLGRPGGNITGLTNMAIELVPKRMQIFKEALPNLSRMALLVNADSGTLARRYVEIAQTVVRPLGITLQPVEIRTPADIEGAFSRMTQSRIQGVCLTSDGLIYVEQERLAKLALDRNLALIGYTRDMGKWPGMLMTYGPSNVALFKRAAYFVDRILKGAKPGDLPVEQPTKIELIVNLRTAKGLGLTIPQSVLARADEVIE